MVKINISTKDEELVVNLVNEIIELSEPKVAGLQFKDENFFKSQDRLYILGEIIKISKLKENNSLKRRFIQNTIIRYKNYKKKSYSNFKKGLKNVINNYYKKESVQYKILFPINIEYEWIKELKIDSFNDTKIEIHDYNYMKNNYLNKNEKELEKYYGLLPSMKQGFSYFILIIYGRDVQSSFDQANSTIELFRGLLNLRERAGRVTLQFGTSQGHPLSDYGPAKKMTVFDSENNYITYYFRNVHDEHDKISSPFKEDWKEKIELLRDFINRFESYKRSNLKRLIEQMILFYNFALDETEPHFSFLYFWQILENIFKENKNEKFDKIAKRIKNMYKNNTITSLKIDILFRKRNNFVHKGEFKYIENEDVSQIKHIVDSVMIQLIYNLSEYKNKHDLIYFFDNVDLDLDVIDKKITALKRIRKLQTV